MIVKRLMGSFAVLMMAVALGACQAEVQDEGELPEVNVEGGDAPNVDVDARTPDVDVSTDTQQVVVPDVDVNASGGDNR